MFLKHNNLIIRNATEKDAELLSLWWNDGKIMAHTGFPNGTGQTAKSIADSLREDTDTTHRRLIIEMDNISIGEMNYRNKGGQIAEIGIKICDFSKQNKGVGKILLSLLISSLFNDFGYQKIILDTNLKIKEHNMFTKNWDLRNCALMKILGQIKLVNCSHLLITNYIKKILLTLQNEYKPYSETSNF